MFFVGLILVVQNRTRFSFSKNIIMDNISIKKSWNLLSRKRLPTERIKGYSQILEKIHSLLLEACHKASISVSDLNGIGLAMPGTVAIKKQVMVQGNTLVLKGKNIIEDLQKLIKSPVKIKMFNDAIVFY